MAREARRLLIAPARLAAVGAEGRLPLEPAETHYLRRVLRQRAGARVELVDGRGSLWSAVLEPDQRLRLEQPLVRPQRREAPPAPPLRLALALPRRETELVWRMACELGVDQIQPLLADHGAVAGRLPLQRWRAVLREATEQCERLWLPELAEAVPAATWLSAPSPGPGLIALTRRPGLPHLAAWLAAAVSLGPDQPLTLAVGPEGGWSEAEERAARSAGWQAVSLGSTILRCSTAAVAGMALLAARRQLSCPPSPSPSS
jgi:16S rRNA (uracil1498-N3)-methyltransferase